MVGVALVYAAGLLQGLVMVSFPASGAVLKSLQGLSDSQYGAIFLPQVALAVVGSIGGGSLARKVGLKTLLVLALVANLVSQLLLGASAAVAPDRAFVFVMLATGAVGLAFGLFGAPLNSLPPALFPNRADAAVVAIHTLLGLGLAVGPLLVAPFVATDRWIGFPLLLAGLTLMLIIPALRVPLPRSAGVGGAAPAPREKPPLGKPLFWLFVMISVLYAFAEGTFSNWAAIFLHDAHGVPQPTAGLAITMFWGALVAGRLATSGLVLRVPAQAIWLLLIGLMIAAFLLLPFARGSASGIGLFALAGLACSAVFPLTITLVARAFPSHVEWASAMTIAALMLGVGLGSFAFGPLRELLSFDQLYRLSAFYPAVALVLAVIVVRLTGLGLWGITR
jgi:predicted MFS family arabinose efflux permease